MRHCPKCQYSKREQWVLDREQNLIPVRYFHVIFTLPAEINQLAKCYPGPLYDILFKAAWYTVKTLAKDDKWLGGDCGMIALLHTWGQNLSLQMVSHVLPLHFQKARYYGLHASATYKRIKDQLPDKLKRNGYTIRTVFQILFDLLKIAPYQCEVCGSGDYRMIEIRPDEQYKFQFLSLPQGRSPPTINSFKSKVP